MFRDILWMSAPFLFSGTAQTGKAEGLMRCMPGKEQSVKSKARIMELVREEDVEFIRLQFTDMFGALKNIAVTANQLERVMDNRYLFDGSVMYGDTGTGEEDMLLCPDLDTFVVLPWRPQQGKVARLLCDVQRADGAPLAENPRRILRDIVSKMESGGVTFRIKPECEFFLFHTDENGIPTTVSHERAGYLDISPLDLGENARRDMVLALEEMGFLIESSHHEKAAAQHEIDFQGAEPLASADQIMTFKTAVRSIAKRFGLHATFMPKPKAGTAGSGMHINISLFRDGRNLFSNPDSADGLSDEARGFIGGIMDHVGAMCAITNPLVNSYKRLASGFDAPGNVTWTAGSGNTLIRVPAARGEDTRIELRFPDPSANPYLTLALCLAAGMDGVQRRLDISPVSRSGSGRYSEDKRLPETLRDAVRLMEKDDFVKSVLGSGFVNRYTAAKNKEWNDFLTQVTEWEVESYLYRM